MPHSKESKVTFFPPYPLEKGQKIRITSGPRKGDWLIVDVTDRKATLRCPISGKEFTWDRFCYAVDERAKEPWPKRK